MQDDVSTAVTVNLLYAGTHYGPYPPAFSLQKLKPKAEVDALSFDIDMGRIESIVALNAFRVQRLGPVRTNIPGPDDDKNGVSDVNSRVPYAIYGAPSLFNHSCKPDVVVSFVGDALVARTIDGIKENEELTIAYVDPSADFEARKEALRRVRLSLYTGPKGPIDC